jgi:hypothetical protein
MLDTSEELVLGQRKKEMPSTRTHSSKNTEERKNKKKKSGGVANHPTLWKLKTPNKGNYHRIFSKNEIGKFVFFFSTPPKTPFGTALLERKKRDRFLSERGLPWRLKRKTFFFFGCPVSQAMTDETTPRSKKLKRKNKRKKNELDVLFVGFWQYVSPRVRETGFLGETNSSLFFCLQISQNKVERCLM